jgi:hypothetical protein
VLFDPNYRQRDVEGYRIYRGRTSGDVQLIAQFDYTGTQMIDYTASFDYGKCAPELGITTECPPGYNTTGVPHDLNGEVVQIPPGGRLAALPDSGIVILTADTAVTGGGQNGSCRPQICLPLRDTGVPFAYTDHASELLTYYYAVTAFANAVKSVGVGSTSLESPRTTKTVVPRRLRSDRRGTVGAAQRLQRQTGTHRNRADGRRGDWRILRPIPADRWPGAGSRRVPARRAGQRLADAHDRFGARGQR